MGCDRHEVRWEVERGELILVERGERPELLVYTGHLEGGRCSDMDGGTHSCEAVGGIRQGTWGEHPSRIPARG